MKSLTRLELVIHADQADAAGAAIAPLTGLRTLAVRVEHTANPADPKPDAILKHLTGLAGLRTLVLETDVLGDESVGHLLALRQLESLLLPATRQVSPAALARLRDGLPNTLIVIPGG